MRPGARTLAALNSVFDLALERLPLGTVTAIERAQEARFARRAGA